MIRFTCALLMIVATCNVASATDPVCPADHAINQAHKLLAFHFGDDERIEIDPDIEQRPSITNPANPDEAFQVFELWGYIYRAQYRIRLTYYPMQDGCLLMGQEVLEYASLGATPHGADPMPPSSGIIREMTLGDRACYLMIERDGDISEAMATMELCERDELIDQFATFGDEAVEVIAMQCQGDPECDEHETVLLINSASLDRE